MIQTRYDEENFLSKEDMLLIYQGKLKRSDAPQLYEQLMDDDLICPILEHDEGVVPVELDPKESEIILQQILVELEPQTLATPEIIQPQKSMASIFISWMRQNLIHPMVWAPVAFALFLIGQPIDRQQGLKDRQQDLTKGCKDTISESKGDACRGAFFREKEMKVIRRLSASSQKIFDFQDTKFQVGDGILFRFRVVFAGYVYLIKQDASGHLEQLYPFEHKTKKLQPSPSNEFFRLMYHGEEQIYVLENKHIGRQTFWLIHTNKKIQFPNHIHKLTNATKKYFSKSTTDYVTFVVIPKK